MRLPLALNHHQRLEKLVSNFSIPTGVKWYHAIVLLCISLITNHIEHLFMCPFTICISSLLGWLFRSFAHFNIRLFVFLLLNFMNSVQIFGYNNVICKKFLLGSISFYSLKYCFMQSRNLKF